MAVVIVWLRRDLRLQDNPALCAAAASGHAVVPLYIDEASSGHLVNRASRYWLHQSLAAFSASLAERGARLILRHGDPLAILERLVKEIAATAVYWNRRYEPAASAVDARCRSSLETMCDVFTFAGHLMHEPDSVASAGGTPYRVFTPFYRACVKLPPDTTPLPAPVRLPAPERQPQSLALTDLKLEPSTDWAAGIRCRWQFGEAAAQARLDHFLEHQIETYARTRDVPSVEGNAMLSPHLCFGEISVRSVRHALASHPAETGEAWLRQLYWREFAAHVLVHFPATVSAPIRAEFAGFEWLQDRAGLQAWQAGMTGYPLVDAGMRELWQTGFMHNRVRMVAASFLCKHLGIHWLEGARWFQDTLVDADLANNTFGWQWVAGCGADAAPYFRIFNPTTQGRKFDPDGGYVRRWIDALRDPAIVDVHTPGAAAYAMPIVKHEEARAAAPERYARLRQ